MNPFLDVLSKTGPFKSLLGGQLGRMTGRITRMDSWMDNWADNQVDNWADNRADNWGDNRVDNWVDKQMQKERYIFIKSCFFFIKKDIKENEPR